MHSLCEEGGILEILWLDAKPLPSFHDPQSTQNEGGTMRVRVALCLSIVAALSCGDDKDRPKEQQMGAALAPQPEAPPPAPKTPPNIVFTSPTRREDRVDEVVAVFDRAM